MTKILLSGVAGIFILSGCLSTNSDEIKASTPKVEVSANKAKEDKKVSVTKQEVITPPESSMKDEVIEEEVEISDDNEVDSSTTQDKVIENKVKISDDNQLDSS
ncbi:MAG: hypothetical protein KAU90_10835, partial [Sulfurovaceae bacterium]|nr:hypothetical protein [Sulfurovaceae bacterium]